MGHQAAANEIGVGSDGAQTAHLCGVDMDTTKIAQEAIDYRLENHQASDMESIKALVRNFLDEMNEPQTERSSYFDGLLSQWLSIWRIDRTHSILVYVLGDRSEQYGNRMLDSKDVDDIDKVKTRFLEQQCLKRGFCLYLSKMTSAINTDPDDALELKMAINLHEMRDLSGGLQINKPVSVRRENLIQKSFLTERYHQQIARQNPYPSPTENTSPRQMNTATSFQDWVLVIMPEGYQFQFLTDNADPEELHDWIKTQSASMQLLEKDLAAADPNLRWGLTLACKAQLKNISIWLETFYGPNSSHQDLQESVRQSGMLETVFHASVRLQDADLVQEAVALGPRRLSLTMWEEVGSTMELSHFPLYRNSLDQALLNIDSLQDRYIVLHSIRVGCEKQNLPQESKEIVYDWIQDRIEQALNEIGRVEENDGAILVLIAKNFARATVVNRIIDFAKRHSSHLAFALEFAFSLYDELVANTMDTGFARYALAAILSIAIPTLCMQGSHDWSLPQGFQNSASVNTLSQNSQMLQADRMARLVRCCLTVGLYNEEHALLRHMWVIASVADTPTLRHVFLPYLKLLLVVMQDHFIPLTKQSYQWQFQQVISLFITHFIGKEPKPLSVDLNCPPLGCANPKRPYGCPTCLELDAFLVDPHQKSADVKGGIDAPEHIATQIQGTDYLQMTVMSHSAAEMLSTIRITKNIAKPEEPDVRHDLWKEKVVKANDMIQAICGDAEWKILLGDKYDECMGLKAVRVDEDSQCNVY
ncbi:MAG: hypothetical protein ASARMPRED_004203 [Alectoria sarmentosa]|nr:MAG: hypothetical protein ASARMPRED_004203 [Alectoria sarmentosa]